MSERARGRGRQLWARIAREPLAHFAVLGGLAFVVSSSTRVPEARRIYVDPEVVATADAGGDLRSRDALVRALADEEMLVREARALGLDRSDPIVRRRLAQKMRFVLEDRADIEAPDDAELKAFMSAHPERYTQPERRSFEQVFVAAGASAADGAARAQQLLEALRAGANPEALGDPFVHGRRFAGRSTPWLSRTFGPEFVEALSAQELGTWSRVRSSLGWHLVRIEGVERARPATLEEVRERVMADWRRSRRDAAVESAMSELRARYAVETSPAAGGAP